MSATEPLTSSRMEAANGKYPREEYAAALRRQTETIRLWQYAVAFLVGLLLILAGSRLDFPAREASFRFLLGVLILTIVLARLAILAVGQVIWKTGGLLCPGCGKIPDSDIGRLLAGRRCRHCRREIIDPAADPPIQGIPVQGTRGRQWPETLIEFALAGLFLLGLPWYLSTHLPAGQAIRIAIVSTGILVIAWPLFRQGYQVFQNQGWKTVCPVCRRRANPELLENTGNCSNCGSQILAGWPPPEPEPNADLPAWEEVAPDRQRHAGFLKIAGPVVAALILGKYLLPGVFGENFHWYQEVVEVLLLGLFLFQFFSERNDKLPLHCPYCQAEKQNSGRDSSDPDEAELSPDALLNFGRCPTCRRRLLRDGSAENR